MLWRARMKQFVRTLPLNIIACFKGRRILWHLLAIVLTAILVLSGFDWHYFTWTRSPEIRSLAFPAVHVGGELPIILPVILIVIGLSARDIRFIRFAAALAQAAIIGSLISSAYKAFTGRVHPSMREMGPDISHVFRFGFWRGGAFWGWPSSHTTIAFAMALTIYLLTPKQRWVGFVAIAYALYVGLGVSVTIHWFSDFVAGAIIGSLIGVVVGKSFNLTTATAVQSRAAPEVQNR
ncbi:MAG TPA: phosphatase PAP2 family protein [Verrucomicrobiae bacterium]|nr:phosphatase PAP2 family protein [Verrucomicrobiae bacterium]